MARRTGRCETFSTMSLNPPGTSLSVRSSSNVSPKSGLKGLRMARSLTRLTLKCEMAKAVTNSRRSFGALCCAALSRSWAYSSCSATRWSADVGSLDETGILIVLRSLPTFLRTNAIRLGGGTVAGGIVFRRSTAISTGKGCRVFGLAGKKAAAPLAPVVPSSSSTDETEDESSSRASSASDSWESSLPRRSIIMTCALLSVSPASASKNSSFDTVDSRLLLDVEEPGTGTRRLLLLASTLVNSATTKSRSLRSAAQCSCVFFSSSTACMDCRADDNPLGLTAPTEPGTGTAKTDETDGANVSGARGEALVLRFQNGRLSCPAGGK